MMGTFSSIYLASSLANLNMYWSSSAFSVKGEEQILFITAYNHRALKQFGLKRTFKCYLVQTPTPQ